MNFFVFQIIVLAIFYTLESIYPFFDLKGKKVHHAFQNIFLGILCGFVGVVFARGIAETHHMMESYSYGLIDLISNHWAVDIILGIILFDLWMYVWHRMNHQIPLLWRFHEIHHSDVNMDSTTAFRFHFVEVFISFILRVPIIILFGIDIGVLLIYEIILRIVITFHHSNVSVNQGLHEILKNFLVTPNMHRVHHSNIREETDSNYGSIFPFWDKLFGTFREREDLEAIRFGVQGRTFLQNISFLILLPISRSRNESSKTLS